VLGVTWHARSSLPVITLANTAFTIISDGEIVYGHYKDAWILERVIENCHGRSPCGITIDPSTRMDVVLGFSKQLEANGVVACFCPDTTNHDSSRCVDMDDILSARDYFPSTDGIVRTQEVLASVIAGKFIGWQKYSAGAWFHDDENRSMFLPDTFEKTRYPSYPAAPFFARTAFPLSCDSENFRGICCAGGHAVLGKYSTSIFQTCPSEFQDAAALARYTAEAIEGTDGLSRNIVKISPDLPFTFFQVLFSNSSRLRNGKVRVDLLSKSDLPETRPQCYDDVSPISFTEWIELICQQPRQSSFAIRPYSGEFPNGWVATKIDIPVLWEDTKDLPVPYPQVIAYNSIMNSAEICWVESPLVVQGTHKVSFRLMTQSSPVDVAYRIELVNSPFLHEGIDSCILGLVRKDHSFDLAIDLRQSQGGTYFFSTNVTVRDIHSEADLHGRGE
jgi:hypothetical protein